MVVKVNVPPEDLVKLLELLKQIPNASLAGVYPD